MLQNQFSDASFPMITPGSTRDVPVCRIVDGGNCEPHLAATGREGQPIAVRKENNPSLSNTDPTALVTISQVGLTGVVLKECLQGARESLIRRARGTTTAEAFTQ